MNQAELAILIKAKDEASKVLNGVGQQTSKLGSTLKTLAVAAATAVTAFAGFRTIAGAVEKTQELGMEVARLSRLTGLSAEEASHLAFASRQVGLEVDETGRAVAIFAKKLKGISDDETGVAVGGKSMAGILRDIGVTALDVAGNIRPIDELLPQIADHFKGMPDGLEKTALAMQLFGRSGAQLIPLLNLGSQGMRELAAEADRLGVTLSAGNLAQVKALTGAQRDLKEAINGVKLVIGFALIPILTSLTNLMVKLQPFIRRVVTDGLDTLAAGFHKVADVLGPLIMPLVQRLIAHAGSLQGPLSAVVVIIGALTAVLVIFGPAIATVLPLLGILPTLFGALVSPIGLAAVAAGALAILFRGQIADAVGTLKDKLEILFEVFRHGFKGGDIAGLKGIGAAALKAGQFLGGLKGNVEALMAVFKFGLGGGDIAGLGGFGGAVLKAGQAVRSLTDKARELGHEVRTGLLPPLKDIGRFILAEVLPPLVDGVQGIARFILALAEWVKESGLLETALLGVKTVLQVAVPVLLGFLKVTAEVVKWVGEHRAVLIALAVALGIVLIAMNPIPAAIIGIIIAIGLLRQHWDQIKAKTVEVWTSISGFINDRLSFLVKFFQINFRLFFTIAKTYFDQIVLIVTTAINTVRDIIKIVLALIHGDWSEAWKGVQQLFSDIWLLIRGTVENGLRLILNALNFAWALVKLVTTQAWGLFTMTIRAALDLVLGWLRGLSGLIVQAIGDLARLLWGKGTDLIAGLAGGIWERVQATMTWLRGLGEAIAGWVGDLGGILRDAGSQAIAGLARGMQAKWDEVKGWLSSVANQIKDAITDPLGIFSPSRVMHSVGTDIMGGLHLGLRAGWPAIASFLTQGSTDISRALAGMQNLTAVGPPGAQRSPLEAYQKLLAQGRISQEAIASMFGQGADFAGSLPAFMQRLAAPAALPMLAGAGGLVVSVSFSGPFLGDELQARQFARMIGDQIRQEEARR